MVGEGLKEDPDNTCWEMVRKKQLIKNKWCNLKWLHLPYITFNRDNPTLGGSFSRTVAQLFMLLSVSDWTIAGSLRTRAFLKAQQEFRLREQLGSHAAEYVFRTSNGNYQNGRWGNSNTDILQTIERRRDITEHTSETSFYFGFIRTQTGLSPDKNDINIMNIIYVTYMMIWYMIVFDNSR